MMIQRWQTVWLLVAAVLMAVLCFVPMALVHGVALEADSATFLSPKDFPVLIIVNALVAVLLFISIFLYKNTRRQKTLTLVSMLLIVVSMATEAMVLFGWDTTAGRVEWLGSIFLLIGALVFAMLAYRGIRSDERLLKAADRLR